MKKRDVIQAGEALDIWKELLSENKCFNDDVAPRDRYVRRYCERYEGLLCYKSSTARWVIYRKKWIEYLTTGFPDFEIRQPVMSLAVGLRYLHANGIASSYKLREFKKDLKEHFPQWIMINMGKESITRGHLNKFIGIWNGNR